MADQYVAVSLYEDDEGRVFLYRGSPFIYQNDPVLKPESSFEEDARALAMDEERARTNWPPEWVLDWHTLQEERLHQRNTAIHRIALWHEGTTHVEVNPEYIAPAGKYYLRLSIPK